MMTGLYPSKHGMVWNTEAQFSNKNHIDLGQGQHLYSHFLTQTGYRNAYIGKWHCGHARIPHDFGIEGWSLPDYGKIYMSDAYRAYAEKRGFGDARARIDFNLNHPEWAGQTVTLHHDSPWHFMNGSGTLVGPPEAHEEQFVSHLAIKKLKELAGTGQPWSLVASYWGPHQPYLPSEPFASKIDPGSIPEYPSFRDDLEGRPLRHHMFRDFHHVGAREWTDWSTWQKILAKAYGQALQTDAAVGELLDTLAETGENDNTVVLWCADHGDAVASHGGLWDKGSIYTEEVARVPLAVRWPARFTGGSISDQLVSNMDVTATMLAAAGVAIPAELDSRSLLPLCDGDTGGDFADYLICEHNGHGESILQRIVLRDRFKYVAALFDGDELYDLTDDPYELHNLISDPEFLEIKTDLRRRIIAHIRENNDVMAFRLAYSLEKGF